MERLAAPADPTHGRAADTRAGRQEGSETFGYQGKDLCIPNTMPEQFARVLLWSGAHPRPKVRFSCPVSPSLPNQTKDNGHDNSNSNGNPRKR